LTKEQRIKAALRSEDVDRIPVSAWRHFSDVDQDPRALAEAQWEFTKKYDYDFIKLMPFGTYTIQDWGAKIKIYCNRYKEPIVEDYGIHEPGDWLRLKPLPAIYGTWGKQLQLAQWMQRLSKGRVPYLQTIFSPLTIAKKLSGDRFHNDLLEHPQKIHEALKVITETNLNFIKANIQAGVSGFFYAIQVASSDVITLEEYREFSKPYDMEVINSYAEQTYFNVIHMHGDHVFFREVMDLPVNCLNWHDRHTYPDFREARALTKKCFLGGIQEVPEFVGRELKYNSYLGTHKPEEIVAHIREAVSMVDGRGLIIGPGCVVDPKASSENLTAVRKAVEL